ncbi:hypothetical protein RXV86_08050 [Alisedimentitalea sp. MJ-SS2]|uniref:hypothetical protein n=1 Tax=Aliisedimentitalea sp. MJ-SS2 TaxID=3049795 RepID=UPI002912F0F6|nr:hypothetical protein [Alisedimentitalea sp. MJ-SS2]MDU8927334.1 hypothetical protein [Alisedimentitalea sp. MJ-SS2]
MGDFLKNLAGALEKLPKDDLQIVSLVVLLVGILAYLFFSRAHIWARVFSFFLIFLGGAGTVALLLWVSPSTRQGTSTTASASETERETSSEELTEESIRKNTSNCSKEDWTEC